MRPKLDIKTYHIKRMNGIIFIYMKASNHNSMWLVDELRIKVKKIIQIDEQ